MPRALAVRIGYVGELGYELYVPQEYAVHVYETLWEAGEPHGIADAGYRAIDACRWRRAISTGPATSRPTTIHTKRGSDSAWRWTRASSSAARRCSRIKAEGVTRKLCSFTIDGFAPLHGGEAIVLERRGRRLDHERRLRPHARQDHCVRLSAGRHWPAKPRSRSRPSARATRRRAAPRCLYDPKMERLAVVSTDDRRRSRRRAMCSPILAVRRYRSARAGGHAARRPHQPGVSHRPGPSTTCCVSRARAPRNTSTAPRGARRRARRRACRSARRCCTSIPATGVMVTRLSTAR